MSSFHKAFVFAVCVVFLFAIPCNCDLRSVVKDIRNGLRPHQGPDKYFCFLEDEECLSGRSRTCSELPEPVCPGHCVDGPEVERIRSLSPYEFCLDSNLTRFPAHIVQARCLCSGCHDGDGETHEKFSAPIQVEMNVVWLNGASSVQQCRRGHHCHVGPYTVTIGCTCSTPIIQV